MNDHELLKLAAAAADVFLTPEKLAEVFPEWDWCETDEPYFTEHGAMVGTVVWYGSDGVELGGTEKLERDPLNDDGDEARLEAGMAFNVEWRAQQVRVSSLRGDAIENYADHGGNKQKARRRAGVRAAAAIGEALKAAPQSPRPAPGSTDH